MAKGLKGIIRLHKWQVDEKRRQITDMEVMRNGLQAKLEKLNTDLEREKEDLAKSKVVNINYASYASAVMKRRENIEASITEVNVSIENMKDELSEAFKELKKYEIVEQRALEREKFEQKKREQERLDEISINMYRVNAKRNSN
ncbi:MAG: flagellar FliJ family protein [Emcibacteraceae bacterium]|nr:flagellar FliJ family protein [Emcibacteraceae bacterium]